MNGYAFDKGKQNERIWDKKGKNNYFWQKEFSEKVLNNFDLVHLEFILNDAKRRHCAVIETSHGEKQNKYWIFENIKKIVPKVIDFWFCETICRKEKAQRFSCFVCCVWISDCVKLEYNKQHKNDSPKSKTCWQIWRRRQANFMVRKYQRWEWILQISPIICRNQRWIA